MNTGAYGINLPEPPERMGDWRDQAACAEKIQAGEASQRWWFPERGDPGAWVKEAKAICAECPVRQDCLDWSLSTPEQHGIWGGVSERGRRKMPKPRSCAECGKRFVREPTPGNVTTICSDKCRKDRHKRQQAESYRLGKRNVA